MNKYILILITILFLSGCETTSSKSVNYKQDKIYIGMNKSDFCYEAGSMNAKKDPCRLTYSEMLNSKPRGAYYPDTKMEIMHNLTTEKYYVFENVTIQHDWYKPFKGVLSIKTKGNGNLIKIFNNYDDAKKFASGVNYSIKKDKISEAKKYCKDQGLTEGTESFAECSLKKLKD
ncbi:hypothetical protein N8729_00810 [Candidatus Pelagibacter sp.]|nr:hypothetical protein [Candidatus Pelagibacter sp.]